MVSLPLLALMTAAVGFLIGLSKGGLGGTLGALATPMMALVLPADRVIGLVLPILMFADIFAVALHWGHWNRRHIVLLLPGSIIGVTLGTYVITNVPSEGLRLGLGIIVLLFTIYKLFEQRILGGLVYRSRNWHGWAAGTITGFSSALAHVGGPPISIYLLMQDLQPRVFVATSALFFLVLNWIKVPYYAVADLFDFPLLWRLAWLMPVVPLGVWLGKWLSTRVPKQTFDRAIVLLLGMTAIMLIVG